MSQSSLTPEFAETVDLPLNPFSRHRVVSEMLTDPEIIGCDTKVIVNKSDFGFTTERYLLSISTLSPILGRGALKKVAKGLEELREDSIFKENNYGKDF